MADPKSNNRRDGYNRPKTPAKRKGSRPGGTHSSPIKDVWPTIDSHKRDEWSTHIYPRVNTEITCKAMLQKLCPTYKKLKDSAPRPPTMMKTTKGNPSTYCKYLNDVSEHIKKKTPYTIEFRAKETQTPLSHATRTICRPDIVAVRKYPASPGQVYSDDIHWSHLEATGEEDSGRPKKEAQAQAGGYTAYHLQARPDLVSVVGIFVAVSGFKLFLSNACRVYHTPTIQWTDPNARTLLYAWMWRLYNPEHDPSITVDMTTSPLPTFTVTTSDNKTHAQLTVFRAGESIGRRTIVLATQQPDAPAEPLPSIVIKEQYIEEGRRFKEGLILEKIHDRGQFPGVVRLDYCEYVKNGNKSISVDHQTNRGPVRRLKTRVVLKDKGSRLADVETPEEFLKGIYDLLEISRALYRKCSILHRDISPENVLVGDGPTVLTEPLHDDLSDMCFSGYLLNKSDDRRARLTTRVILIDFDSAEDQDANKSSLGNPKARTGTPVFMARMVRSNIYPDGVAKLPAMPAVAPKLLAHYQSALETRLQTFPTNEGELIDIPENSAVPPNKFRHLPRYDAESVFWYLLWWCMQAQPEKVPVEDNTNIPHADWGNLTSEDDRRDANFIKSFPRNCLHPSYYGLVALLDDMRKHLSGDLEFSIYKEKKEKPEYMHEVFQRLILNFLVANKNKSFMKCGKSKKPRLVKPGGMNRTKSTQASKGLFEDDSDSKHKKQKTK